MKLYRALLHVYPASFRAEYGEEMWAIHAQRIREASNPLAGAAVWMETLFEILFNALFVHLDILRQDLRYAARTLARSRGFAITAIVVAALGIGATTAAFTVVDHVMIRPLPFPDPERIVKLYENNLFFGSGTNEVAPANYRDWKRMAKSFETMGAYRSLSVNMIGEGEPQRIDGASMTVEIFPLLGMKPALGRFFTDDDDRENSPRTVVLSYGLWQGEFGGDPSVLGRKILLDDAPNTVIGVMPKSFYFPNRDAQLWTAMRWAARDFEDRTDTYIYGVGKLKRGVSLKSAAAEMRIVAKQLERAYPKELAHVGITIKTLRDDFSDASKLVLRVLFAASLCLLLVACTNLGNLLMARALARRKELAVRAAIGAGKERLIRQLLTETLILSGIGGAVGIVLANFSLPLLVRLVPTPLPISEVLSTDWRILSFTAAITFATGIGFGVAPALRVCHGADEMRDRSPGGGRKERLRSALVVAEVAGSMVLLVSCGLLVRALWRVQAVDPGFRAQNVLTLRTSLPMPKYELNERREQFYERVLSRVRHLPGISVAAYTSFLPMIHGGGVWPVEVEERPQPISERQNASLRFVTPGYFQTMGIPLLRGRDVTESDKMDTRFVAVVSKSLVDRYWPNQDPLGRQFDFGNHARIVAGVVGDIHVRGLERPSEPQVYLPYKQHRDVSTWYAPKDLVVRASGDVAAIAPAVRRIIREADAEQPISDIRLLEDIVDSQTSARRVQLGALGAFAGIAFLLAAIGIHGVLSFAVSQRIQEIGVRMALGARQGDILRMILGDGVLLSALGAVLGVGGALGAGQAMRALLAGVQPSDIVTFAAAIVLCTAMTLIGSLPPALRAARVDPTTAIRFE